MTVLVQGSRTHPMTQTWTEITLEVDKDEAEAWADALLEAGALSVQAEDADADSPDEQPLFGEPVPAGLPGTGDGYLPQTFGWKRTRLAVLFDGSEAQSAGAPNPPAATGTPETASTAAAAPASVAVLPDHIQAVLDEAATALQKPLPAVLATRRVDDQDWVRITQAQFDPIPVGQRLLILPSWHAAEAQPGHREALIIDPGLAFGTGSHPTTRMCLEWLDEHDVAGLRVIDYGCGSGILAIAAARLGAAEVIGIDIDPQAVLSTTENARINRVQVTALDGNAALPAPAQLVVANILSTPLKLLAPILSSLVAPGGRLVLSGVLERQIDEVARHYDPVLQVHAWRTRDGWACLTGSRPV